MFFNRMYFNKVKNFLILPVMAVGVLSISVGVSARDNDLSTAMKKQDVYQAMKFVSDWQWSKFDKKTNLFVGYEDGAYMGPTEADSHPQGWVYGSFHVGMAKWAKLADAHGDESYFKKLYPYSTGME